MAERRKRTIRARRQDHLYKRHHGCSGTVEPDLDSDLEHQRDSGEGGCVISSSLVVVLLCFPGVGFRMLFLSLVSTWNSLNTLLPVSSCECFMADMLWSLQEELPDMHSRACLHLAVTRTGRRSTAHGLQIRHNHQDRAGAQDTAARADGLSSRTRLANDARQPRRRQRTDRRVWA